MKKLQKVTQEKNYVTVTDEKTLLQLIEHIENNVLIAYDTETTSLNPRTGTIIGFSVSAEIGKGFYFPTHIWKDDRLEEVIISNKGSNKIAKIVLQKLQGKNLITHNGSFDLRYTKNFYKVNLLSSLHADTTLLVHTVLEEGAFGYGKPFGLKSIAKMIQKEIGLDVEVEANEEQIELKESIKKNGGSVTKGNYELYKADLEILSKYACADTDLTLRIYHYYLDILKKEGLEDFFFEEEVMPVYKEVTIPMEDRGIRLDIPLLESTRDRIIKDMETKSKLVIEGLLKEPEVRNWIMKQAITTFPPKNRGAFAQKLLEMNKIELPRSEKNNKLVITKSTIFTLPESNIKNYLTTGDLKELTELQYYEVAISLWKEFNKGEFINIQSKDQLGRIASEALGLEPLSITEKDKFQFNEEFVQSIKNKYDWAKNLRIYNKLSKIKSSYIDRFLDVHENGIFYPYFKQHGTLSGRYGSDLQQLPKPLEEGEDEDIIMYYTNLVRRFFICREGSIFIDTDYASLEPRVFASVAGDQGLKDIFNNDLDFYSHIAIKTEKLEGVSAHTKAENFLKKVNPVKRQQAKAYSLGVPYGMTGYALAKTLDIPTEEGDRLVEGYLDGFPELRKWIDDSRAFVKANGYIKNKVGRIRHLPLAKYVYDKWGDGILNWNFRQSMSGEHPSEQDRVLSYYRDYKNALNNSLNYQIQSYSASIVNRAALKINRKFRQINIKGQVIAQIHDQLICEVEEDHNKEEACRIVQDCMENTIKLEGVQLIAVPEIARNFADGH